MKSIDKTRRLFLATSAIASGLVLSACPPPIVTNEPPSNGAGNKPDTKPNDGGKPIDLVKPAGIAYGFAKTKEAFFVGITDLVTRKTVHSQEISFYGHGLSRNPIKPNTGIVFEKHGPGCAQIDMKTGKTLKVIKTTSNREFYGHGAFSPDGKILFAAETDIEDDYKGVVGVRDGESFEYLGDFPTFGTAPHDCHLIDDGATLVFTNGGGDFGSDDFGSVTYVDVKSEQLKETVKISDPEINAGHMTILSNGDFVVVSAPRNNLKRKNATGNISFYDRATEKLRIADDPICKQMISETLSVAVHEESGVVAATNPAGHIVTFWDFKTGKLVHSIDTLKWPRGIALTKDGAHFAITHIKSNSDLEITLFDARTFKPIENNIKDTFVSGSHLYVI